MKALESVWEMVKLQTGWCLEACTKPSEASSPAEHDNGRAGVTARSTSPPTPVQSNGPNPSLPNSDTSPF